MAIPKRPAKGKVRIQLELGLEAPVLNSRKWSAEELAILDETYPTGGANAVRAKLPHRSQASIADKARRRKVFKVVPPKHPEEDNLRSAFRHPPSRLWQPWEDAIMQETYPRGGVAAACKALPGRTKAAISNRGSLLGLKDPLSWSVAEDDRLSALAEANATWAEVEAAFPNRTRFALVYRLGCLKTSLNRRESWTPEEIVIFKRVYVEEGREAVLRMFPAKSKSSVHWLAHKLKIRVLPKLQKWKRPFSQYQRSAKKRNLEWGLSYEQAAALFEAPCTYCGSPPSNVAKKKAKGHLPDLFYSGIDRVDNNTRAYLPNNSVSCCAACNYAKGKQTEEEFIAWLDRVATFRTAQQEELKPQAKAFGLRSV